VEDSEKDAWTSLGLGKRMPKFDYQGAHAIYKAFFEPLGELTQGKKHMVASTSSALAKLPFAVLRPKPSMAPTQWMVPMASQEHGSEPCAYCERLDVA
jgi:hypothetical protein